MLEKLKDLAEMKKQAGAMQAAMAAEKVEVDEGGVKIVMSGNMEVERVEISEGLDKEIMERQLKDNYNQAIKKVQRLMAQKIMGGM